MTSPTRCTTSKTRCMPGTFQLASLLDSTDRKALLDLTQERYARGLRMDMS